MYTAPQLLEQLNAYISDNLYNFGIHLGIAFQLKDDYLDVYGDSLIFGKN
ncbi:hypothetical protein EZS27_038128, partial [termite gut metagenome]